MARPRTHEFWVNRITGDAIRDEKLRATVLRRDLESLLKKGNLKPPAEAKKIPDERTIRRIMQSARKEITEEEKKEYRWAKWPQTFANGDLPWEASRAVLDLIAYLNPRRPTINEAKDFWRFTQAAPDAPIEYRWENLTVQFRITRVFDGAASDAIYERALAFKEWAPKSAKKGKTR